MRQQETIEEERSRVHTKPSYRGLTPPFALPRHYPEFAQFPSTASDSAGLNHAFAAVREALCTLELDAEHYGEPSWNSLGEFVSPGAVIVLKPDLIRSPAGLDALVAYAESNAA